jgi:hypothetical protein
MNVPKQVLGTEKSAAVQLLKFLSEQPNQQCSEDDMMAKFDAWLKKKGLFLVGVASSERGN